MPNTRLIQQHPYAGKPRRFFEGLDLPAVYPEAWSKCLNACGGDTVQAREFAVDWLEFVHSPVHGPETFADHEKTQGFKLAFGCAYQWDRRRFLRHLRRTLRGKRKALAYWRAMTKGVRP